ncbi:unnamed protein product [Urochloa humidicola]
MGLSDVVVYWATKQQPQISGLGSTATGRSPRPASAPPPQVRRVGLFRASTACAAAYCTGRPTRWLRRPLPQVEGDAWPPPPPQLRGRLRCCRRIRASSGLSSVGARPSNPSRENLC